MPTGILDIGSTTVHLIVLNPAPHARPTAIAHHRWVMPLMLHLQDDEALAPSGIHALTQAVDQALGVAREHRVTRLVGMATSAFRELSNGRQVLAQLSRRANTPIRVLTGSEESEFTFVAARRWAGWGAGRLLVVDIGGSSLQIAHGQDEIPDQAFSLPLGAGRLTHQFLGTQPASSEAVEHLRRHIRGVLEPVIETFATHCPDLSLGTSTLLLALGQFAGESSPTRGAGSPQARRVSLDALQEWCGRLGAMSLQERATLPGMSPERARVMHCAALVAVHTLTDLGVTEFETCPWALREGVLLGHNDQLSGTSTE